MDLARADALAARSRLTARGWIPKNSESFRHIPPPALDVWLGDAADAPALGCDASPLAGAGWTLHPIGNSRQARVDAQWLDAADAAQRAELFANLALPGDGDAAPFAWAHRAAVRRGLRLRIGGAGHEPGETVWLQLRHQPREAVESPMLVIEMAPNVRCVLIETHDHEHTACDHAIVQNLQVHLRLAQDATLQHLRIANPRADDRIAHHLNAVLDRGARYDQALIASGSRYHLQRSEVELHADRASARSACVLFAAGSVMEQQLRMSHAAANTRSSVDALVLASGRAQAVVNAHTRIAPGADEADVRQRLSGIPTSGQPRLVLRPHLEIHHDKVQAAHGATWGALPEDALFYAQQRGLDERRARGLIVEGMARAVLERCLDEPEVLQTLVLDERLAAAAARHLASEEESVHG